MLKQVLDGLPCPGQLLKFQTYPRDNTSNIADHSEVMVSGSGDHVYPIIITESKQLFTAAISLIANEAVFEVLNLNFSEYSTAIVCCTCTGYSGTFDVQSCNIYTSTDQSSIMVECRFVVNPLGPIADLAVIFDSTYCRRHK